jgi:hypothetical protein
MQEFVDDDEVPEPPRLRGQISIEGNPTAGRTRSPSPRHALQPDLFRVNLDEGRPTGNLHLEL